MNKTILLLLLLVPLVCFADEIIDTTSEKSISESLKGKDPEDVKIINQLVCDAGHGLDQKDPKAKALALDRLRARLKSKTVSEVASEVRAQRKVADEQFQSKANALVAERRRKWQQRLHNIASIEPGTEKATVIKLLGEPDAKSDSATVENWLYRYDANQHGQQIWIDCVTLQISDGTVVRVTSLPERRNIEDMATPTPK